MAKSRSLLRLVGKMGGMVFYEQNGETVAREHVPISKDRIMSDVAFERTRENMKAFSVSGVASKVLVDSLRAFLRRMGSKQSFTGLVKIIRAAVATGTGFRGELPLTIVPNRNLFLGYDFKGDVSFGSAYSETYTLTANAARNSATLILPAFNPLDALRPPQGATHFRIALGIVALSDYTYNPVLGRYEPTQAALNGIKDLAWSADTALAGGVVTIPSLTAVLPGSPILPADLGLVTVMGIEFLQLVSGATYLLHQGNAMVIAEVF